MLLIPLNICINITDNDTKNIAGVSFVFDGYGNLFLYRQSKVSNHSFTINIVDGDIDH